MGLEREKRTDWEIMVPLGSALRVLNKLADGVWEVVVVGGDGGGGAGGT
jgi:hypothetical protein